MGSILRDRGNKKWAASLIMPEHMKELRKHQVEIKKKDMPNIDPQHLELMEETIREGMEYNQALNFVYFRSGDHRILVGKVHYVEPFKQELRIVDEFEVIHKIFVSELLDVRIN